MVNVSNIGRVIASIQGELPETQNLGFNMGGYVYPAGDVLPDQSGRNLPWIACVCGHAYILSIGCSYEQAKNEDPDEIEDIAQGYLGITDEQANALFFDLPEELRLSTIPPHVAIAVLHNLANTGVVDWIGYDNAA